MALARGIRQAAPHTGPPFNDATANNPCGRPLLLTANGVDFSTNSLCLFHLMLAKGQKAVEAPYTQGG